MNQQTKCYIDRVRFLSGGPGSVITVYTTTGYAVVDVTPTALTNMRLHNNFKEYNSSNICYGAIVSHLMHIEIRSVLDGTK